MLRFFSCRLSALGCSALLLGLCASIDSRAAEHQHNHDGEWLLLLSGEETALDQRTSALGKVDVLLSHTGSRFRALAETVVSTDEVDVERLQFGWEPAENTLIWAGRFHQPASAWNTEHHHGQYLQTAITRPSIENWEDDGALIPQHILGVLFDTRQPLGNGAGLHLALGLGGAPVLESNGFSPFNVSRSNRGGHKLSVTARVAWLPEFVGASSYGLLLGTDTLAVADVSTQSLLGTRQIDEDIVGIYTNWIRDPWRLLATAYYVDLKFDSNATSRDERFGAGYVQIERELPQALTLFARHENSLDAKSSRFVAIQQDRFWVRRSAAGLRWDFSKKQAITLELAQTTTLTDRFAEYRLQWSAVVP
jgi:hypothetical protein